MGAYGETALEVYHRINNIQRELKVLQGFHMGVEVMVHLTNASTQLTLARSDQDKVLKSYGWQE